MSYLALGFVAGFAAVERKGFLQAMLSRPVALGAITGAVLGDVQTGLLVGVPLELLWLGAINLGASLPVHEALGTAAAAGTAVLCMRSPAVAAIAGGPAVPSAVAVLSVALCSPLASLGRRADRAVERWNERLYARAERSLAAGEVAAAVRVNLLGLAWPFAIAFAVAPAGAALAAGIIEGVVVSAPGVVAPLAVAWVAFCGFACASGGRTMRSRRAPAAYFGALAVAAALLAAWMTSGSTA